MITNASRNSSFRLITSILPVTLVNLVNLLYAKLNYQFLKKVENVHVACNVNILPTLLKFFRHNY